MPPSMPIEKPGAWVTLLTNVSYLPGTLVVNYGLRTAKSKYPLVVMTSEDLPLEAQRTLDLHGIEVLDIQKLIPNGSGKHLKEPRFIESWTKLRAFGLVNYERVVLIDSDMVVLQNMDDLIEMPLDAGWIAACHACACNPRKIPHYPADWIPKNCAYTNKIHPAPMTADSPRPYGSLNSGLVVLQPSEDQMAAIERFLEESPAVETYQFPDQDLLADVYSDHWKPLSYTYNALKTLRVIHSDLWRDADVKCIHYILNDKPWKSWTSSSVSNDINAAHYGVVNEWWWDHFRSVLQEVNVEGSEAHKSTYNYLLSLVTWPVID